MGRCEYVLAKDSRNNTFEVRQVNEPCGNGEPSCTKSLTVIFPNVTIQLLRGSVMVNDTEVVLPATYGGKFFQNSYHIYMLQDLTFKIELPTKCMHCANLVEYRSIFKNIYFRKEVGHIPLLYLKEVKTILPSIEVTLVEILLQTAASYLISKLLETIIS